MDVRMAQTDVVVVGGGLAGITAACYLARGGLTVRLFEKSTNVGGRASTQIHDGYSFNRGIHALYCGGAGEQALQELGITYSGQSPKRSFALRQGRLSPSPADPITLLTTDLLGMSDKLELLRLLMRAPGLKAQELSRMSVQAWLERNIRRPRVREFVAALARTFVYSAALDVVSAEVFVKKLQVISKHPVIYIDGGWQSLVDGLRTAAERAGVQIVSGVRVEAIEHEAGRVSGVRLHRGVTVRAAAVVLATTPQDAVKLVDEAAYPALRTVVDGLVPAQVACLDVALRYLPSPRYSVVQDVERPRFMSAQSLYSRIAPMGGALIHTFKQLNPMHRSDPREDERELEALLDTVQPGWREVLVKRIYLPRMEAVGMLPMASSGGFAGRPGPQVAGLPGLYLAGDWVGSEGFLSDASFASARQVAQMLLENPPPYHPRQQGLLHEMAENGSEERTGDGIKAKPSR